MVRKFSLSKCAINRQFHVALVLQMKHFSGITFENEACEIKHESLMREFKWYNPSPYAYYSNHFWNHISRIFFLWKASFSSPE